MPFFLPTVPQNRVDAQPLGKSGDFQLDSSLFCGHGLCPWAPRPPRHSRILTQDPEKVLLSFPNERDGDIGGGWGTSVVPAFDGCLALSGS